MIRIAALALLTINITALGSAQTQQSSISLDDGEQRAIDQLRAVVESIKSCPPLELPPDVIDPLASEGFVDTHGPPQNVVWDVELHPSIRARYVGSVEFSEPSYFKLPPDDSYCNKPKINKSECRRRWVIGMQLYKQQADHPLRFRYQFDVTSHGLEFLRAFKKTKQTDDEQWADGTLDSDACASKAIKSVLNKSEAQSSVAETQITQENQPRELPKALWDAAVRGETDAQFTIGTLYAEGNGVPQDYTEAYFWLDIAASGNSEPTLRETIIKARDASASHLTQTVLLQTQERARKWFEEHLAK